MLSKADNDLLTLTGPGTAMGNLFREFWHPVALQAEVAEVDAAPKRLTILGEDMLLFRQSDGRLGLVEPRCPHRGADLFWGRNEECGLRCIYHGWKFDVDGNCVDIPNMVPGRLRDNFLKMVRIHSYPIREWGGMVWAWMGNPANAVDLPRVEWALVPDSHRYVSKKLQECNWAQALEGAIDTAHFTFVHRNLTPPPANMSVYADKRAAWIDADGAPYYEVLEHDAGLVLGGARRGDPGETYWRISQYMVPNHATAPNAMPGETYTAQTWVPVDDENCWIFTTAWNPERPLNEEELFRYNSGRSVHAEVDENYVPLRRRANDYMIDREAQKTVSFTGITGLSEQDACVQDSQGRIADRTRETLTPSDEGVVRFRKLIMGLARKLETGERPAAARTPGAYRTRSGGAVSTEGTDLATVMQDRFGDPRGVISDAAD